MTSQEILRAFQEGKISLEDAKKALNSIETSQEQLQARESGASWKEAIRTQTEAVETQTGDVGTQTAAIGMQTGGIIGMQTRAIGTELTPVRTPTALKHKEAIAIVGMSGKYPDASNLSEYWENLVQGKNAIREVPLSRWDPADYYDPNPAAAGKMYCKWLGALEGIEYFDPLFFHLSPAEAETMDPQQRLFLEEGYKAFEDAGYRKNKGSKYSIPS